MLKVTLLGTSGMMPTKDRWLSSCLLCANGHSVLIDCGEGTQIAMRRAGEKFKPIDIICITHFHADHISGLPGILLSLCNDGRTEPLTMLGPKGLSKIVSSLCVITPGLTFDIICREYSSGGLIEVIDDITVKAFLVRHGIPCLGYTFMLSRKREFQKEKAIENNVPLRLWSTLHKGKSAEYDGILYTPEMVLGKERKGLKVTYCTDTRPVPTIAENAADSDLFICEGMYGDNDKLPRAKETYHMLFSEAAGLALSAQVKRLWLTHYSPSLNTPEDYLSAAADIFPSAECGTDGKTIELEYTE